MLIEREEAILLDDDEYLADNLVGGLWTTFRNSIPSLQCKELDKAFNLIMLSNENSLLPSQLTSMLIDEYADLPTKKQNVYVAITTNIIELLTNLGITLDDDVAGEDKLRQMNVLVDFFFELREYQDLIGLKSLLESQDIPPVNRYLQAMQVYWGEDFDISDYECLLLDVSEVTIKAIKDALFSPDETEAPPESLQRRIVDNKEFLKGTKAYEHVTSNGQLGGSITNFVNFFKDYLEELLEDGREQSKLQYAKEVLGFYIISDVNDGLLKDNATKRIYAVVDDMALLMKIDALIEQVILP